MTRLCGRIADGVLLTSPSPAVKYSIELVRQGAKQAGRSIHDITIVNTLKTYIGKAIDDKGIRRVKANLAYQIANTADPIHELSGINLEDVEKVRTALNTGGSGESKKWITREMIDAYTLVGSMDDCLEQILQMIKAGVNQVSIADPIGADRLHTIRRIGEEIIPHLRDT